MLAEAFLTRAPLISPDLIVELLTAELNPTALAHLATDADILAVFGRLLGREPTAEELQETKAQSKGKTLRELYRVIVGLDSVRAAFGRISGSYAW